MGPWATANYCRAVIKSLRGTMFINRVNILLNMFITGSTFCPEARVNNILIMFINRVKFWPEARVNILLNMLICMKKLFAKRTKSTFYSIIWPQARVNIKFNNFVYRVNIMPSGQIQHFTQHDGIQGEHFAHRTESTFYSLDLSER